MSDEELDKLGETLLQENGIDITDKKGWKLFNLICDRCEGHGEEMIRSEFSEFVTLIQPNVTDI